MIAKFIATLVVGIFISTAALASPVGVYTNRGTNPGSGTGFSGIVEVTRTGETYRIVWVIGGQTYSGTGIGNDDFIAVSYRTGNETGIALYGRRPDGSWHGVWTYANGRQIGTDRWTPR